MKQPLCLTDTVRRDKVWQAIVEAYNRRLTGVDVVFLPGGIVLRPYRGVGETRVKAPEGGCREHGI